MFLMEKKTQASRKQRRGAFHRAPKISPLWTRSFQKVQAPHRCAQRSQNTGKRSTGPEYGKEESWVTVIAKMRPTSRSKNWTFTHCSNISASGVVEDPRLRSLNSASLQKRPLSKLVLQRPRGTRYGFSTVKYDNGWRNGQK